MSSPQEGENINN